MVIEPSNADGITNTIRKTILRDRALHDKAQKAFVSWVRSYSKHTASSIFRVADLDWEDIGRAWGLLKLPKMPELKAFQGDKYLGLEIDWTNYAYNDKKREEQRKQTLLDRQSAVPTPQDTTSRSGKKELKRAWSDKLDAKDEREMRREKKHKRRDRERWEAMTPIEREKQRKLDRMIEEVKARKAEEDEEGEFNGFED